MLTGGLFTRDFLIEGVRGTVAWQRLDDASLVSLQDRLKTLFASFGNIKNPNESETEKELIWPLLEAIGWAESKIITRFWIAGLVMALFALTTLKLR